MHTKARGQEALGKAAKCVHARKACAHLGNAGQGLLPSRPQGQALLAPIRVGLRSEGLRARRPQTALMRHQNRSGFSTQYFGNSTLGRIDIQIERW